MLTGGPGQYVVLCERARSMAARLVASVVLARVYTLLTSTATPRDIVVHVSVNGLGER